jgi:hypothetical protein
MDGLVARDPRVLAILTTPDDYFARVRRQAWIGAGEDIAVDLARRAKHRRDSAREDDASPVGRVTGHRKHRHPGPR